MTLLSSPPHPMRKLPSLLATCAVAIAMLTAAFPAAAFRFPDSFPFPPTPSSIAIPFLCITDIEPLTFGVCYIVIS